MQLINSDGRPTFGAISEDEIVVNHKDYTARNLFNYPLSQWWGQFRYKQFQFFGLTSSRFTLGLALADLNYLGVAYFYLYDHQKKKIGPLEIKMPPKIGLTLANQTHDSETTFQSKKLQANFRLKKRGEHHIWLKKDGAELECRFVLKPEFRPFSLCTPCGPNGYSFTQKTSGNRLEGSLRVGKEVFSLEEIGAFGHFDFTAGKLHRETSWNWACGGGELTDGSTLGLNFSCGVNETGETENLIWLDGKQVKIGNVSFNYQWQDMMSPWKIESNDGVVRAQFTPEGKFEKKTNFLLVAGHFVQLFGKLEGTLQIDRNTVINFSSIPVFFEEHFSKW